MSGISTAIGPTEALAAIDERPNPDRDSRKQPRRPRPKPSKDDLVEVPPHRLDLEA
jgi:hypothetical protein